MKYLIGLIMVAINLSMTDGKATAAAGAAAKALKKYSNKVFFDIKIGKN